MVQMRATKLDHKVKYISLLHILLVKT